jgi:acetyl esterase/lipase
VPLPVIVYMHGGGWILGNAATHDRLVRELAVGARAALAFVEYPNSPEARYPVAIEQGYATAQWITRNGASKGLDASRMAVAGESVGGNMTAALALMAKERSDVTFVQQSMYYPVTDAAMNTDSYQRPFGSTAPSTTSCCSTASAKAAPREPPSARPPPSCAPGSERPSTAASQLPIGRVDSDPLRTVAWLLLRNVTLSYP